MRTPSSRLACAVVASVLASCSGGGGAGQGGGGGLPFAARLQLDASAEPLRSDFQWAADRLAALVTGPEAGLGPESTDACGEGTSAVPITTGPGYLAIVARIEPIDGQGNIIALSGPCIVRRSDGLPIGGVVRIDAADLAALQGAGTVRAVILHEMLHVLGFGSLWDKMPGGSLLGQSGEADLFFSGGRSRAAFRDRDGGAAYSGTPVPVDSTGGTGTRGGHWRPNVFGGELMVPSVFSPDAPLSRTTLESLADLGWHVNAGLADPFTIASGSAGIPAAVGALESAGMGFDLSGDVLPGAPRVR